MKAEREWRSCRKIIWIQKWIHEISEVITIHKNQGEAAPADVEATANYPEHLDKKIDEDGYNEQQIFQGRQNSLILEDVLWDFTAEEEKRMFSVKDSWLSC
jgi:hypothetical protein